MAHVRQVLLAELAKMKISWKKVWRLLSTVLKLKLKERPLQDACYIVTAKVRDRKHRELKVKIKIL